MFDLIIVLGFLVVASGIVWYTAIRDLLALHRLNRFPRLLLSSVATGSTTCLTLALIAVVLHQPSSVLEQGWVLPAFLALCAIVGAGLAASAMTLSCRQKKGGVVEAIPKPFSAGRV